MNVLILVVLAVVGGGLMGVIWVVSTLLETKNRLDQLSHRLDALDRAREAALAAGSASRDQRAGEEVSSAADAAPGTPRVPGMDAPASDAGPLAWSGATGGSQLPPPLPVGGALTPAPTWESAPALASSSELPPVLARDAAGPESGERGADEPAPAWSGMREAGATAGSEAGQAMGTDAGAGAGSTAGAKPVGAKPAGGGEIQWESFLGVKLFAWLGGLALFLGVAFFVKYSFDHNLIPPPVRVAIGYVVGLGLIAGGLWLPRVRHAVTVQSLCATGVLILYGSTFGAQSLYGLLGVPAAFAVMCLVTTVAFLLAIRLEAQGVAVLGLLGGFLTPVLLSTGVDNPGGLFGYLALLDAGLLAVVMCRRWNYLALLAAVATGLLQMGWLEKFFAEEKVLIAMAVFLGFAALFNVGLAILHRKGRVDGWIVASACVPILAGWFFASWILAHPYRALAQNVVLYFGYVFLLDLPVFLMARQRRELRPALHVAGILVFFLLMAWTMAYLKPELLEPALVGYLLFAVIHTVAPLVLERLDPMPVPVGGPGTKGWVHIFPSLSLLLILVPLLTVAGASFWVWPVVLCIDLLAIVLAVMTASLVSILFVFLLTVVGTAAWIFQLPGDLPSAPGMLTVVAGFAIFFVVASVLAARRVFRALPEGSADGAGGGMMTRETFSQMASLAAALPFILLSLVIFRLPLANPAPVFGVAGVLVLLLLGVGWRASIGLLAPVALGSVLMLEHLWHFQRFTADAWGLAFAWHLGFGLVFLLYPFVAGAREFAGAGPGRGATGDPAAGAAPGPTAGAGRAENGMGVLPWVTAGLSLPLHFLLLHRTVMQAHPGFAYPGLLPAVLALPCLAALLWLVRRGGVPSAGVGLTRLALLGGATLFFITLVFPIQFERHWITIGWALEGAALLWLFHRVPHPGLRVVGVGLLAACFVRLAMNPLVITAYGRTGTPVWNWYLYTYGVTAACLYAGGWLLAPPRDRIRGVAMPPLLHSLATVLLFLLLNIEIADYFSPPGGRLVFDFSGSFAQDMAYSLGWGLFAFALTGVGFRLRLAVARYAGIALLVVTLLKLFLHDLWRLGGLYRIGSLVGLAVVLIVISFLYQRFLSAEADRSKPSNP